MSSSNSQRRIWWRTEEGITATRAKVETRLVIIERNVLRADVMVPPFDFIDQLIGENHWDYQHKCFGIVYPRLVRDFYGFLEVSRWAGQSHLVDHSLGTDFSSWCCTYWDCYRDRCSSFWGQSFPRFCGFPYHGGAAHVFWSSASSTGQSLSLYQDWHIFLTASTSYKNCAA